jgi:hypothetical protein
MISEIKGARCTPSQVIENMAIDGIQIGQFGQLAKFVQSRISCSDEDLAVLRGMASFEEVLVNL